jgi:hypothetical protein
MRSSSEVREAKGLSYEICFMAEGCHVPSLVGKMEVNDGFFDQQPRLTS